MLNALSLGWGSIIQTDLTLLVGETLEVEISVEEEIDVAGEVVHTRRISEKNFILGLSFENILEIKKKVYNHFSRDYVENFEGVSP